MEQAYLVKRAEPRVYTKATALLVGKHGRFEMETGFSENVSSRGARVITAKEWLPGEIVLFALPGFRFTSAARVAYCDSIGNGRFGTGLEFAGASEDLEITAFATAIEFPRAQSERSEEVRLPDLARHKRLPNANVAAKKNPRLFPQSLKSF